MPYEMKHESGSLWRNENKERESHADYSGTAKVDGREYYMDAWINEATNGKKYMSIKFKEKNQAQSVSGTPQEAMQPPPPLDDSIPF